MSVENVSGTHLRGSSYALVVLTAVAIFVQNLIISYQHSLRNSFVSSLTTVEWVVIIAGTYVVLPGLLFVAFYTVNALGPDQPMTGTFLLLLFSGVLTGSLLGQYVGGAPHQLIFLLTSDAFASDPGILQIWFEVFGPVVRDFFTVIGVFVVARSVQRQRRGDAESPVRTPAGQ